MNHQTLNMLDTVRNDFRLAWRGLILTDLVCKAVVFVVLFPLVSLLFRLTLAASGIEIITDQDILIFLLGPVGWITFILVSSVFIAILALEQAALIMVIAGAAQGRRIRVHTVLAHTRRLAWPILQIAARVLTFGLVTAAPFLLAMGAVYLIFLRQYDASYYLLERPPAFWIAAGLTGTIGTALGIVLIRVLLPVIYALPLTVFEGIKPQQAFRTSRQRAVGHLRPLTTCVVGWMAAMFALSTLGTSSLALLGTLILPMTHHSLWLALTAVGLLLILSGLVNLCLNILGTITFSIVLINLYRGVTDQKEPTLPFSVPASTQDLFGLRISRRRWVLVSVAVLIVMPAVGVLSLYSIETNDNTEIVAHRGASATAPENSMAAVEQAIADQADWLEIDVQTSLDGMILVTHDDDLKRMAGSNIKVSDTHSKQLREMDIGKKFSAEFTGQRIPTLEEVLVACKGKIGVIIELKHYGPAPQLEQRVIDLVEAHDMSDHVQLMSLKYDSIKKLRARRPSWQIGLLSAVCVGDLTRVDADFLAVSTRIATRAFVLLAHRREKPVYVWTVNDPVVMSTMISRGVKCIITDKPALAREVLRQRAEMAPVERLLLELAILCGAVPESGLDLDIDT